MMKYRGYRNIYGYKVVCGIPEWLGEFLEIKCTRGRWSGLVGKAIMKMGGVNKKGE